MGSIAETLELARQYVHTGNFAQAEQLCRQILQAADAGGGPSSDDPFLYAEVHNALGKALVRRGNVDEGIQHYRESLRLHPDFADALFNLGNALQRQGNLEGAVESFQQSLLIRPDMAVTY